MNYMTAWYSGCTKQTKSALQRFVKAAQDIIGTVLPLLDHLHNTRRVRRARNIMRDVTRPGHNLFQLLPSKRLFRSIYTHINRLSHIEFHKLWNYYTTSQSDEIPLCNFIKHVSCAVSVYYQYFPLLYAFSTLVTSACVCVCV